MALIQLWLSFAIATYLIVMLKTRKIKNKPKNHSRATFKFCMTSWYKLLPSFLDGFKSFNEELTYRYGVKCKT